jgi:DMSO/TMAO reductase YedYZ heme-binding membrane subunit
MSDKFAWYLARSSGWVAFVLLACTVVWGVLGISRLIERKGLPRWLLDLHRHLAALTVVFTAIHLGALVGDNFMQIGWREIMVPFALEYRSGAVAWGVVAMYLLIAIQLSSWLRARMPRRWWRAIHFLSYPALWMVTVHGLRAGTDADSPVVRNGVMIVIGIVAFVTLVRVFTVGPRRRRSDGREVLAEPGATRLDADGSTGVDTLTRDDVAPQEVRPGPHLRAGADGVRTG